MATPQTIAAVAATAGTPTPIFTGPVTAAVSFSIANGLATIVLDADALPEIGYNLHQQVTLWGFTTATYFNGTTITITANNPPKVSFSFPTTHDDVASTDDAGNTAPKPFQSFHGVRIGADLGNTTKIIYVGDGNVSDSQYTAALTLAGQTDIWFGGPENTGQNIDAHRIFIDTDETGSKAQVTLLY